MENDEDKSRQSNEENLGLEPKFYQKNRSNCLDSLQIDNEIQATAGDDNNLVCDNNDGDNKDVVMNDLVDVKNEDNEKPLTPMHVEPDEGDFGTDDEELDDTNDDDSFDEDDDDSFDDDDGEEDESEDGCSKNITEGSRGLVGLQNLGNTCYMNGALQALSNCQQLTRFVLDCPGFLKEKGLCRSYSDLIREMWNSRSPQYAVPTSIIRNIKCIYPAFRGCTQQDTQEFLRCFLEQLHDELKQPIKKTKQSSSSPSSTSNFSEETDRNTDTNNPNNIQRSIISDTFEFKISSSVVCSNCNNISTTKETFKDLSIPIPCRDHPYYQLPVNNQSILEMSQSSSTSSSATQSDSQGTSSSPSLRWDKCSHRSQATTNRLADKSENDSESCKELQTSYLGSLPITIWFWNWLNYFSSWFWGPQVKLQDCLSIFFGTDPLEGDNEYSCEVCTKKNRGVKYLKILELPEVLCIHFKRYESIGSAKITTHVSFPLTGLDLAPFMSENSEPQCTTYNLIACICHHGSALLTGHYTTYALNCYDDQWYEFDDQYVNCVQDYQVENSEAYILFYQKTTLDDRTDRQRVKASKILRKSLTQNSTKKYFISKQWVNKFNTFVEPGPITNSDFLCEHKKVPMSKQSIVGELCHQISGKVWRYLKKLHGGGPECKELKECDICDTYKHIPDV